MNKKVVLISAGVVIVLLVIFISVFISTKKSGQNSTAGATLQSKNTAVSQQPNQGVASGKQTTILPPLAHMPKEAAKQFYKYYFSQKNNPLANGAYKTNPYLSQEFKTVIGSLYHNGDVPVFCPQNKYPDVVVGKETPVPYYNTFLMQEVISTAPPKSRGLYSITLQQTNGKWLIFDVNCLP